MREWVHGKVTEVISEPYMAMFLFTVPVLALLAAMVVAPVPLSLDGPSHIYNAVVMRHLFADDTLYREHFSLGSPLIPNWLASVIAAAITMVGVGRWSIVVMNALVVLLMVVALYFVVRRSGGMLKCPEHHFYVLTILMPLAANVFIILGFWGFLISAALCFVVVGLLQDDRPMWRRIAAPVLVLLGFWAHPVPVLLTVLIPAAGYARAMFESRSSGHDMARNLTAGFAADMLPWGVTGLLIASFTFVLASHGAQQPVNLRSQVTGRLLALIGLAQLEGLAPTATMGGLFSVYIALIGVGVVAPCGVRHLLRWQLTIFMGMLLVLYFIVPESVGNGLYIAERVLWIALVASGVIALSGGLASNLWYLRFCAICAAIMTVVFVAEYVLVSRRMEPAVQELRVALAQVPRRSKMLLLGYRVTPHCWRWPLLEKTRPERHWALMETIPRELIVLNDYEPGTGHFPVEYRDQRFSSIIDAFGFTVEKEAAWGRALDATATGTFVLSWGVPSGNSCDALVAWVAPPLGDNLRHHYELRYEQVNNSRVQVWERRNDVP